MGWFSLTLLVCLFIVNFKSISMNEVQFDRIESLNSSYVEGIYNLTLLRVGKFNRTTYVLNCNFETFVDIDHNWEIEASYHYNRFNNNQYNKSPMRVARSSIPKIFDNFHEFIVTDALKNNTNVPFKRVNGEFPPIKKVSINSIFIKYKIYN